MEYIIKDWGVQWYPGMPSSKGYVCTCGWSLMHGAREEHKHWAEFIVGFTKAVPMDNPDNIMPFKTIGGMIFECPKCFSYFWNHLKEHNLESCVKRCEKWPKNEV
ncbi:MAG: hypothetical protein UT66_C0018G0006 [candidate division CPR2 bacterium GW2011_GWC1_39_9]|uniref:Uncharacterized protein n=1 Tax=candidate division CPR2 bacterium GW2011_GWC2_39_10 TaxID=1618345 RepID=A0A0G0PX67_UNCC2|nr:MAG: hypothetical protein UT18_C0013G0028 [candidate division CPR2 bacterium GW2011_GWC2_39_10]KKR34667.1 MAG: hypothetical protein UT66_C0018G0006 [candidate division CPR2 bacterium GW2011_GWC1_39_9]